MKMGPQAACYRRSANLFLQFKKGEVAGLAATRCSMDLRLRDRNMRGKEIEIAALVGLANVV